MFHGTAFQHREKEMFFYRFRVLTPMGKLERMKFRCQPLPVAASCCGRDFFIGIQSAFLSIKGISLFRPPLILCLYGALWHGVNIILAMVFPKLKYAK